MTGTNFNPVGVASFLSTARDVVLLTKGEDAPPGTRALLVENAGTVNIKTASGSNRVGVPLPAGIVPLAIQRLETGGTATGIWALV